MQSYPTFGSPTIPIFRLFDGLPKRIFGDESTFLFATGGILNQSVLFLILGCVSLSIMSNLIYAISDRDLMRIMSLTSADQFDLKFELGISTHFTKMISSCMDRKKFNLYSSNYGHFYFASFLSDTRIVRMYLILLARLTISFLKGISTGIGMSLMYWLLDSKIHSLLRVPVQLEIPIMYAFF